MVSELYLWPFLLLWRDESAWCCWCGKLGACSDLDRDLYRSSFLQRGAHVQPSSASLKSYIINPCAFIIIININFYRRKQLSMQIGNLKGRFSRYRRDLGVVVKGVGGERAAVNAGGGWREETEVWLEGEDDRVGARVSDSKTRSLLRHFHLHIAEKKKQRESESVKWRVLQVREGRVVYLWD